MTPQEGTERFYHLALALILGTLLMTALVVAGGLWWAFDTLDTDGIKETMCYETH